MLTARRAVPLPDTTLQIEIMDVVRCICCTPAPHGHQGTFNDTSVATARFDVASVLDGTAWEGDVALSGKLGHEKEGKLHLRITLVPRRVVARSFMTCRFGRVAELCRHVR